MEEQRQGKPNKYTTAIERAVFNMRRGEGTCSMLPILNALHIGADNGAKLFLPLQDPDDPIFKSISDVDKLQVGDHVVRPHTKFKLLHVQVEGEKRYLIPICTSWDQVHLGGQMFVLEETIEELLEDKEIAEKINSPDCLGFMFNPFGENHILFPCDLLEEAKKHKPEASINLIKGSVLDMHVGAIVNAANKTLLGGGGVDGAIHRAAGPGLLAECRLLGGCETGEAKITGAYNIKNADHIIHTVGPVYRGKQKDFSNLSACYTNSLNLACANGCTSIAFPCISTGVYGFPIKEAAKAALVGISEWYQSHEDTVMDIYLCCYREEEYQAYEELREYREKLLHKREEESTKYEKIRDRSRVNNRK